MLSKLRRPEYVFLLIAIPFYLILFIILPPVAGFDENTHAVRIEQLSEFNLFSDFIGYADPNNQTDEQKFYGGSINANYWKFIDDWFNSTHLKLERYRLETVPELYDQSFATPEVVNVVFSNTAVFILIFPFIFTYHIMRHDDPSRVTPSVLVTTDLNTRVFFTVIILARSSPNQSIL